MSVPHIAPASFRPAGTAEALNSAHSDDKSADKAPSQESEKNKYDRISITGKLVSGDEQMRSLIKAANEKYRDVNKESICRQARKFVDFPVTPTWRMQTAYETTVTETGYFFNNDYITELTGKRVDKVSDEACPGRYFINGTNFFDEAAKLFQQDKDYLDDKRAWLLKDISRYAKDCVRFFGGEKSDVAILEKQINSYIRNLADGKDTSKDLFTVRGIDFSAKQFTGVVETLNQTLAEAKTSSTIVMNDNGLPSVVYTMNTDELVSKMSKYADDNLSQQQKDFVLSTKDNWKTYSVWAKVFSREEGIFKYM